MLCFRNSLSSFTSVSFVVGGIFRETIILTLSGNQKLSNDRHIQHKCGVDPAYWSQTSLKCILASSKGDWLNYFAVSNSRNFAISFTVQDSNRQPPSAAADSSVQKKLRYKAKQPAHLLLVHDFFAPSRYLFTSLPSSSEVHVNVGCRDQGGYCFWQKRWVKSPQFMWRFGTGKVPGQNFSSQ